MKRCTRGQHGFTLVELMVSASILAVLLYVVLSASGVITRSLDTNERSSDAAARARQALAHLASLLRPASLAALRARAGATWTFPAEDTPYQALRFQEVTGIPNGGVTPLAGARTLEFLRDPKELADGVDNNGNGLVDEGCLWLTDAAGARTCVATGVESFQVTRSGHTVRISLSCGSRDSQKRVLRHKCEHELLLRNN